MGTEKSVLQAAISAFTNVTLEQTHQNILHSAREGKAEKGQVLCIDNTVTETAIPQ